MNTTVAARWFREFWRYHTSPGDGMDGMDILSAARKAQEVALESLYGGIGNQRSRLNINAFVLHNGTLIEVD